MGGPFGGLFGGRFGGVSEAEKHPPEDPPSEPPHRGVPGGPPGGAKNVHFVGYLIILPVGTKFGTFFWPIFSHFLGQNLGGPILAHFYPPSGGLSDPVLTPQLGYHGAWARHDSEPQLRTAHCSSPDWGIMAHGRAMTRDRNCVRPIARHQSGVSWRMGAP